MSVISPFRIRAVGALVMVNLLWGISFPVMKAANQIMAGTQTGRDADHFTAACFLIAVRFSLALVLLGLLMPRLFLGLRREHWSMGAWVGLAFSVGFVLQIVGLNYIPASRSGFLTSLSVIFTPIAMVVLERRMPRLGVLVGALAALLGTGILTGMFELRGQFKIRLAVDSLGSMGIGDWLTVLAAVVFTVQLLLIDHFSRRMPAGQLTPGMFVATLGLGSVAFLIGHSTQASATSGVEWTSLLVDGRFMLLILIMSFFCTVLAFHWMNKYQPHVSATQAAMIYTLEPTFATLWAMVLPDILSRTMHLSYPSERPGLELLVGGLLIVTGNALALWPEATSHPSRS